MMNDGRHASRHLGDTEPARKIGTTTLSAYQKARSCSRYIRSAHHLCEPFHLGEGANMCLACVVGYRTGLASVRGLPLWHR
jgi:hypothetical protein